MFIIFFAHPSLDLISSSLDHLCRVYPLELSLMSAWELLLTPCLSENLYLPLFLLTFIFTVKYMQRIDNVKKHNKKNIHVPTT